MAASSGSRRRKHAANRSILADREAVMPTAADVSTTSLRSTAGLLETDRQAHRERRAAALLAAHGDRPAVTVQDVPGAGETDACAANFLFDVAGALKSLEDTPLVSGGDADAVVRHVDPCPAPIALHAHVDRPAVRTVLDGVVEQVGQDAPQASPVPPANQLRLDAFDTDGEARRRRPGRSPPRRSRPGSPRAGRASAATRTARLHGQRRASSHLSVARPLTCSPWTRPSYRIGITLMLALSG